MSYIDIIVSQLLSGISRGMMLFLIASGLTLTFSVMNVLNFAHAAFWLLGAYVTWTVWALVLSPNFAFWIAVPLAVLIMAAIGCAVEYLLIRRVYDRPHTEQLLLTYALVLVIGDLIKLVWGVEDRIVSRPDVLSGYVMIGGAPLPIYNIFLIGLGCATALGLWWFMYRTPTGRIVRAAVYSREMVSALGIPIHRIYLGVFALSISIAGLAGGVQAPMSSITLGMDMSVIVDVFCITIIGGLGSLMGAFVASLIVGISYAFAILFFPKLALILIFAVTALVLIFRPWGLFGTPTRI